MFTRLVNFLTNKTKGTQLSVKKYDREKEQAKYLASAIRREEKARAERTPRTLDDTNSIVVASTPMYDGSFFELRRSTATHTYGSELVVDLQEMYLTSSNDVIVEMKNKSASTNSMIESIHALWSPVFKNLSENEIRDILFDKRFRLDLRKHPIRFEKNADFKDLISEHGLLAVGVLYLCEKNKLSFDMPYIKNVMSNQIKLLNEVVVDDVATAKKLLDPKFSAYGLENYDLLKIFDTKTSLKKMESQDFRDYLRQCCYALIRGDENVVVGSAEPVSLEDYRKSQHNPLYLPKIIFGFPTATKAYRDYLLGLTVKDFKYLSNKFTASDCSSALKVSEILLADRPRHENNRAVKKESANLTTSFMNRLSEFSEDDIELVRRNDYNTDTINVLKEIVECAINGDPECIEAVNSDLVKLLLDKKVRLEWVDALKNSEIVIGILRKKMSAIQVKKIIAEVQESGTPVKLKQWIAYAEGHEEFKNIPVSWWLLLV